MPGYHPLLRRVRCSGGHPASHDRGSARSEWTLSVSPCHHRPLFGDHPLWFGDVGCRSSDTALRCGEPAEFRRRCGRITGHRFLRRSAEHSLQRCPTGLCARVGTDAAHSGQQCDNCPDGHWDGLALRRDHFGPRLTRQDTKTWRVDGIIQKILRLPTYFYCRQARLGRSTQGEIAELSHVWCPLQLLCVDVGTMGQLCHANRQTMDGSGRRRNPRCTRSILATAGRGTHSTSVATL